MDIIVLDNLRIDKDHKFEHDKNMLFELKSRFTICDDILKIDL